MFPSLSPLCATTPAQIAAWQAAAQPGQDATDLLERALAQGLSPYTTLTDTTGLPRSLAEQVAWKAPWQHIRERLGVLKRAGWDVNEIPPGACALSLSAPILFYERNQAAALQEAMRTQTQKEESNLSFALKDPHIVLPYEEDWFSQPNLLDVALGHFDSLDEGTRGFALVEALTHYGCSFYRANDKGCTPLDRMWTMTRDVMGDIDAHFLKKALRVTRLMKLGVSLDTPVGGQSLSYPRTTFREFLYDMEQSGAARRCPEIKSRLWDALLKVDMLEPAPPSSRPRL